MMTPTQAAYLCALSQDDVPPKLIERQTLRTCSGSAARVAWVRPWLGEAERTPTPHVSAGGPWEAAPTRTARAKKQKTSRATVHATMRVSGRRAAAGTYISRFPGAPPALPNILGRWAHEHEPREGPARTPEGDRAGVTSPTDAEFGVIVASGVYSPIA